MITKVEPFFDDFNDGNLTGWYQGSEWWHVSDGVLTTAADGTGHHVFVYTSDADYDLEFDYTVDDLASVNSYLAVQARRNSSSRAFQIRFYSDHAAIYERTQLGWDVGATNLSFDTEEDATYHVKITCDGSSIKVWRWEDGALPAQVFNYTTGTYLYQDYVQFLAVDLGVGLDNIRIVADDLSSTHVSTHNNANELRAMAMPNGASAMAFGYDAWGRQTSKTQGSSSGTYGYRYGSKLYSVASNFPDEGSVTYNYGGDQKRRQRTVGGVSMWSNWGIGWSVLNEESGTGSGTLQKTYIGGMAEVAGSNPATGAYSYYATDNLGSPRAVYDQAKALVTELDFTPYGQAYTANDTIGITHRYTGHDWDSATALYFAPYRFYNPQIARWMSRDPLGMVDGPNVYQYVSYSPIVLVDLMGTTVLAPRSIPVGDEGGEMGCAVWKMWKYYRQMRRADHIGADKYFHCMANCEAAKCGSAGAAIAQLISWLREVYGEFKGDPAEDRRDDEEANDHGRNCPDDESCKDRCKKYRPSSLPAEY